jgi:beta-N-acetylhexosaminidase
MSIVDGELRLLAGQRLMVGFDGTTFNSELKELIRRLKVGGVILFSRNIVDPSQLRELCFSIQRHARSVGLPPLFIAIDQEGGTVARLKKPFTCFPEASKMKGIPELVDFARVTARELTECGVNMNMAPVLDVAPAGLASVMASRSYGNDPLQVSERGGLVIDQLQRRNIMAVAKHFPGIGRTVLDSHLDMPILEASLQSLREFDLIPFRRAVMLNVAGIMLSHIFYPQLDPVWPASLSPAIAGGLLRREIGYQGLVFTDDLDMGAIRKHYDIVTAVDQILAAEIDIVLICHKGPDIEWAWEQVHKRLRDSGEQRLKGLAALERILQRKRAYLGRHDVSTA